MRLLLGAMPMTAPHTIPSLLPIPIILSKITESARARGAPDAGEDLTDLVEQVLCLLGRMIGIRARIRTRIRSRRDGSLARRTQRSLRHIRSICFIRSLKTYELGQPDSFRSPDGTQARGVQQGQSGLRQAHGTNGADR